MVLLPLPYEHIYSYFYRCYRVHSLDAMHTIINDKGLFKQRLGFIPYKLIGPFLPEFDQFLEDDNARAINFFSIKNDRKKFWWREIINPTLRRSGFVLADLKLPISADVISGKCKPGLKIYPRDPDKRMPEEIKFCPRCVRNAIKLYGVAYLASYWLSNSTLCKKCSDDLVVVYCGSRKNAVKYLEEIFLGELFTS